MLAYAYHKKSANIFVLAVQKYPWLWGRGYLPDSIEARYHLLEYISQEYQYDWMLEKNEQWYPLPIQVKNTELFWSLSHTESYVGYIIADHSVGIDIVEVRERHNSLFSTQSEAEYTLLGAKNWTNFSLLWSAKEAIIKASLSTLDDMVDISLQKRESWDRYIFVFRAEMYKIKIIQDTNLIIAYTL